MPYRVIAPDLSPRATRRAEFMCHEARCELPQRLDDVPRDRPIAVVCGSGYRASVAASLLLGAGCDDVANVLGGMSAWSEAGLPMTH